MSDEDVLTYEGEDFYRRRREEYEAQQRRNGGGDSTPRNREGRRQSEFSKVMSPESGRRPPFVGRLTNDNINAFSGAIAGVTSGIAVCPLDVAKTKLQAQGGFTALQQTRDPAVKILSRYSGMVGTVTTIVKEDGFRGLYRGLVPIIIGYLPTWTVYFLLYEKSKKFLLDTRTCDRHPFLAHISSALVAGTTSTLITNPIWVVKTRLMSQNKDSIWHYRGTMDAFRSMYTQEGIRVFYSGLGPALLGLSHVAVQFPLYEQFKLHFTNDKNSELYNNLGILASSGLSKVVASSVTYPHEVIRTRNQIQSSSKKSASSSHNLRKYRGILQTARAIYLEEGWRAFYAGLGTNMFRAVPSSLVTLFTYELVSRHLTECRDEALYA